MANRPEPLEVGRRGQPRLRRVVSGGLALLLCAPAPLWARDAPLDMPAAELPPDPDTRPGAPDAATTPTPPAGPSEAATSAAEAPLPTWKSYRLYRRSRHHANVGLGVNLTGTATMGAASVMGRLAPDDTDLPSQTLLTVGAFTATVGLPPTLIGPLQMRRALRHDGIHVPGGAGWLGVAVPALGIPMMLVVVERLSTSPSATLGLIGIPALSGVALSRVQYHQNQLAFHRAGWDHLSPVPDPSARGSLYELGTLGNVVLVVTGSAITIGGAAAAVVVVDNFTPDDEGPVSTTLRLALGPVLLAGAAGGASLAALGISGLISGGEPPPLEVSLAPLVAPGLYGLGVWGRF